jgi:hypothetical protein
MSEKKHSRYSASFTAGSLLHKETSALLRLFRSENAEQAIREEIKKNEFLHINSESARKRIVFEIIKRTQTISDSFWTFYADSTGDEQKVLLFFLCLKTYPLMFDFHFNVTLKQWNTSSHTIEPYYYQMELEEIAAKDEIVDNWADITKRKTISVYLRILKELKLLDNINLLHPLKLEDKFWQFFVLVKELWFLDACLLSNDEKERIMLL